MEFRPHTPVTLLRGGDGEYRVAVQGRKHEVRQLEYEWSVVVLDLAGLTLWAHRLHAPPLRFVSGANGTLIVSGTPTRKIWDAYGRWQDLSKDPYVRCLAADGTPLWTWYGPGPLTSGPLVGPDGMIYVGSQGRVWALSPTGSPDVT
jgi:outer membrane protein assembly factor BamB